MGEPTFKDLELGGWTARARSYDDWLAPVTRQAIDPILDVLGGPFEGRKFSIFAPAPGISPGRPPRVGRWRRVSISPPPWSRSHERTIPAIRLQQPDRKPSPPGCKLRSGRERLRALAWGTRTSPPSGGGRLQRVRLSATQKPIEAVAPYLMSSRARGAVGVTFPVARPQSHQIGANQLCRCQEQAAAARWSSRWSHIKL